MITLSEEELIGIIDTFIQDAERELNARWEAWAKDLSVNEMYEVIGALLARQTSLAINVAKAPET